MNMLSFSRRFAVVLIAALTSAAFAQQSSLISLPTGFEHWDFKVDGIAREALAYIPSTAKEKPTPAVFVFHGHGGTASAIARRLPIKRHWPEAISIYMQGLNTPGRLTDPQGKVPGWQKTSGEEQDRDLKFFDAVLTRLEQDYKLDKKRVFATGHSNGGAFTYLLWAERGDTFAAVAPCAGFALGSMLKLKPKPMLHIAGENDPLVKFEWQERAIEAVRKLNGCDAEGKPWADHCTLYPSSSGTPVVAFIHPGKHEVPAQAPALIAKFFKEFSK